MPASLVRILLLRAGIEPNPGPTSSPPRLDGVGRQGWICCVCQDPMTKRTPSVKCNNCDGWSHWRKKSSALPNCSNLTKPKDYSSSYLCQKCKGSADNTQLPCDSETNCDPGPPPPPPSPPPPPTNAAHTAPARSYNLKIVQLNVNGLKNKLDELIHWLHKNDVKIAALQETKLHEKSKLPNIPQYNLVREDRQRDKGGGVAYLIHESILFEKLPKISDDPFIENISIKIDDIKIMNLYIPPASSCPNDFDPTLNNILNHTDSIILGDINAHDSLWCPTLQDARGSKFADEINQSDYGILNTNQPTRLPTNRDGQPSSPDITLASMSLMPYMTWEPRTTLGSDHLPLLISCSTNIQPQMSDKKVYVNFKKADWQSFHDYTEQRFSALEQPSNIHKAERCFRKILNDASKKFIPQGRIKQVLPELPAEAIDLMKQRDATRVETPDSPRLAELNKAIETAIRSHKRTKWRETISSLGHRTDSGKLFKIIRNLNGQPPAKENSAIKFKGRYITSAQQLADCFNKQYTSIVRHKTSRTARTTTKTAKKLSQASPLVFSPLQTQAAIKKSKASKAIGPDGISNIHLKHIGIAATTYLTNIFNISMASSLIPDIWKQSTIIPLLKPGKPADESTSFRPVSLLCPSIKILEKLILPTLQDTLPIPEFQHGFRPKRSTVTALSQLNMDISAGFNHKPRPAKRTVLLQLDLSKAFDMVNLDKLLSDLNNSALPSALKRWFSCYLHGRQAKTSFRNRISKAKNVRTGVPQGAVTSPILFNFYLSKMPSPPSGIKLIQYADDISIYATGRDIAQLGKDITNFTKLVVEYLEERALEISPPKSTVTLFTPWNKEADVVPPVYIKDVQVKLDKDPKLLGVYFSTMHTFSTHCKKTASKAKKKLNVLKALAGTDWGQDKETLLITYKATCKSVLEYGSPVWSPNISDTSWSRLQTVQNSALRLATGSYTMAAIEHLHRECKILPLQDHGKMLAEQYLAACHLHGHPGQGDLGRPPDRNLKQTYLSYKHRVADLIQVNDNENNYKKALKLIHTRSVSEVVARYPPNRVLGQAPPEIHPDELTLSRKTRSLLSQLRSGFSNYLQSYKHRLDPETEDKCPDCSLTPHDTNHLFCCPSNPTVLTPETLWTNPVLAAHILKLDTEQQLDDD